ncbi:hypothetical protein NEIPOLOT_01180 [Neisseria polysaccharea ATCC 43768]|nr:hypothetical protein NEIPOLOT_01180 [Neisseria polysaccharea ATCC 43768]
MNAVSAFEINQCCLKNVQTAFRLQAVFDVYSEIFTLARIERPGSGAMYLSMEFCARGTVGQVSTVQEPFCAVSAVFLCMADIGIEQGVGAE